MLNKKKANVNSVDTVIGSATVIEGNLTSKTSLRIEGEVHGEVVCDGDITIGKDGHVDRSVKARNVVLAGKIEGDVEAQEKLHILSTGKLYGRAKMSSLMIEEGATFEGESQMSNKEIDQNNNGQEDKKEKNKKNNNKKQNAS